MQAGLQAGRALMNWGTRLLLRKNPQLFATTLPTPFQVPPVGSILCNLSGLPALPCPGMPSGGVQPWWRGVKTQVSGGQTGEGPQGWRQCRSQGHMKGRPEVLSCL